MKNTYYKITKELNICSVGDLGKRLKYSIILNIILLIILTILLVGEPKVHKIYRHTRDTIQIGDVHLSDSGILKELTANQCVLPAVAVAQARIETGNYSSKVCTQNKNLFGIKYHKCDYVLGENLNHASYKSYKDNIKCYIHIQNRYLRNIDGRYAEAGNYIPMLKSMQK